MKTRKIYYQLLGLVIHSIMLILLFSCGKPEEESKNHSERRIRTEMDEELEVLNNASPKVEKRLQAKTKILRIRIYPKNVLNPVGEFDRVRLPNCGRGDWDRNEVYYDKTKVSWKNYTQNPALTLKSDLHFKASSPKGGSINASLEELLKSGGASISAKPNFIEIKLPSTNWPLVFGQDELDIELSLIPTKKAINVGNMKEVRKICTRSPRDPPRGADGGRGGGIYKSFYSADKYLGGFGFAAQVFEVQYDLEIYFISHY